MNRKKKAETFSKIQCLACKVFFNSTKRVTATECIKKVEVIVHKWKKPEKKIEKKVSGFNQVES